MRYLCVLADSIGCLLLIALFTTIVSGCAESDTDTESCGKRPNGSGYPSGASYSDCGRSICGAFYEYSCDVELGSWTTEIIDCFCETVPPPDPSMICNPVTQAGCVTGEKCSYLSVTESPHFGLVACVPEGNKNKGESCDDGLTGQNTGFDNCVAGFDCFQSQCQAICDYNTQTCESEQEACVNHAGEHFNESIGLCLAQCDPALGMVVEGVVQNSSCEQGMCVLDIDNGQTTCSVQPPDAAMSTQNQSPVPPEEGSEFAISCAPGFSSLLTTQNNPNSDRQCARYCSPEDTYLGSKGIVGRAQGVHGNCDSLNLSDVGGRNGHEVEHQCRHIQTMLSDADQVPSTLGLCVPVRPVDEGILTLANGAQLVSTFGDCSQLEWQALKEVWNTAAPAGMNAAQEAFDAFCLTNPDSPASSYVHEKCAGYYFGCLSGATLAEMAPAL